MICKRCLAIFVAIMIMCFFGACRRKPNSAVFVESTKEDAQTETTVNVVEEETLFTESTEATAVTIPNVIPDEVQSTEPSGNQQHSHSYGKWLGDQNSKTHTRVCACGHKETEDHSYSEGEITQPTHTTAGSKRFVCQKCGQQQEKIIPANVDNHSYGKWESFDNDYHLRKCICGDELKEKHTWQKSYLKSDDQIRVYECFCGASKEERRTEFKYVGYYAEFIVSEDHTGKYYAMTKEEVLKGIADVGGTLVGEVQRDEIITKEYKGSYFEESGRWYYLVD